MLFLNPYLDTEHMKTIFSSTELLTKISGFFADYYGENSWQTPKTLKVYEDTLNLLEKLVPEKGNILDIGCGKGTFLQLAKKRGWNASGIEPNFTDAQELIRNHQIEMFQGDFLEIDLPKNHFDVISLWDLIEHVPNPGYWIERISSSLKPGGLLLLATPNHFSLLDSIAHFAFRCTIGKFSYALRKLYTVDHTLYFTDQTLKTLLEKMNFLLLQTMKVNTDLDRYTMSKGFRMFSDILIFFATLFRMQNRMIMISKKN